MLAINVVCLIGSTYLLFTIKFNTPLHDYTPEEFQSRLKKITTDEKLQKLFIADDTDIRALENLDNAGKDAIIFLSSLVCGLSLIHLIYLIFLWKNRNLIGALKL
ncbi:MAG TPA: hypothetical protein VHG71_10510 [Verrucomicrobiae bacterium]|nr:hypothetical protein [Verrucomicrobiae bacterium]